MNALLLRFISLLKDLHDLGLLGGQNKIPHLRNDRKLADGLIKYILRS